LLAACKVVAIYQPPDPSQGPPPNLSELQKEVKVHKALQHDYILKFLAWETHDLSSISRGIHPGLYILLELAQGGDLFDKIGTYYTGEVPAGWSELMRASARRGCSGGPRQVLLCADGLRHGKPAVKTWVGNSS
jgi:serine/threonine protein kinase